MRNYPTYLVTGGAGFIGSALIRQLIAETNIRVVNVDVLTYAGDTARLSEISEHPRYVFEHIDIGDQAAMAELLKREKPDGVFHLAAESHVDRSIDGPMQFALTNTLGTLRLLDAILGYWLSMTDERKKAFRFVNVSTDEVYGSLGQTGTFTETTAFAPRSPYSASKAGADHFADAYFETYGLPVLTTHASNNYGPFQFPEKLLPLALSRALAGEKIPLYGDGTNVRDWLYVDDHARGLRLAMENGVPGETYLMGGNNELSNREVLNILLGALNKLHPGKADYRELITLVTDRPGHDLRYAVDSSKAENELDWSRSVAFEDGVESTVMWYLDNQDWLEQIRSGRYNMERMGVQPVGVAK